MDAPTVLYALRWLIHDTFRQTIMSRVMWIMLALSGLCIVFCLGVSVKGGAMVDDKELFDPKTGKPLVGAGDKAVKDDKAFAGDTGKMSLMFGLMDIPFSRTAQSQVHFLLCIFASWIAGTIGVLMALVWTAGFVPESLQPSAASVLLAKPAPRWLFLAGKYLGVVCFVALHVSIFFLGTWLALGFKTNIWLPAYLLGIPLLVLHFAVVYSFSVMLAVLFRSTMACVVGTVLFWFVCFGINYGRAFTLAYAELNQGGPPLSGLTMFLSEAGYWVLPKPCDFTIMLEQALDLSTTIVSLDSQPPFNNVLANDEFYPISAMLSSCGFAVFAMWASASQLEKTDY
jgi:ABC-type transport system involved in multi-copper enzyme maturation permease subunit